jgi:hypothetical protein
MIHDHFSWVHIVRGRPRHPASQGSVERSHGPYKYSLLAKLKENNSDDWVHYMHIVQCEINNRPVRSRGDLSPYSMYYSNPNKAGYFAVLGKAYKKAKTEYGLRLAKMVLDQVKVLDNARVFSTSEVEFMIKTGDDLFQESSMDREPVDKGDVLAKAALMLLRQHQYDIDAIEVDEQEVNNTDGDEMCYDNAMDWEGKCLYLRAGPVSIAPNYHTTFCVLHSHL